MEDSPVGKYIGPYHSMSIPLRSLPFIHSTYTRTRNRTRKYTRRSSVLARLRAGALGPPLAPGRAATSESERLRDTIRQRHSHSTPSSDFSVPKYGT